MDAEVTERVCTKCRLLKSLDEFSHAPRGKYGRKASCKQCDAERHARLHPAKPRVGKPRRPAFVGSDLKTCTRCNIEKTIDEFSVARVATATRNAVYRADCKQCQSERAKDWFRRNPERTRRNKRKYQLRALYGLDIEAYEAMEAEQGFVCAICRNRSAEEYLHVDHNHRTGEVRGLLCNRCNRAMGMFEDDLEIMHSAVEYLRRAEQAHQSRR